MEYLLLLSRLLFSYILLSSSYEHLTNKEEFKRTIFNFKILSNGFITPVMYLLLFAELGLGITLLFGVFLKITLICTFLLFLIFTISLIVNLLKGRNNINCGCGGLMGNHKVSWKLVLRNSILLCILLLLTTNTNCSTFAKPLEGHSTSFDINTLSIFVLSISIIIIHLTIIEFSNVKRKLGTFIPKK